MEAVTWWVGVAGSLGAGLDEDCRAEGVGDIAGDVESAALPADAGRDGLEPGLGVADDKYQPRSGCCGLVELRPRWRRLRRNSV